MIEVSEALGFKDADGMRGVERFMQQYFRHAKHAGEITRIILVDLEEQHVKHSPRVRKYRRDDAVQYVSPLHGR